jgi:tRNA(Ile)-lysidine synthase
MPRRPPAVARVLTQATATMRAHRMVEPGELVLVAVSGGPDSVCLLYTLHGLRRLFRMKLAVFHFDHRLREDSAADAAYVRRLAERLSVPFHLRVAAGAPSKGESVEAWATGNRSNAGNDVRREIGAPAIAEGHTLDDQAETVLLNLVRGTGIEGLAGIEPGGPLDRVIQPLLEVTRADVEAFCRALHLRPRRDPMNEDRRYLRAAVRHDVLPMLERATGRGVREPIVRTADTIRRDRDELRERTVQLHKQLVDERDGAVRFDAAGLTALSEPVAARLIRFAAYQVLSIDAPAPWTKAGIEAILDLAGGRPGRRRDLSDGRVALRDRTHVVVTRTVHDSHPYGQGTDQGADQGTE